MRRPSKQACRSLGSRGQGAFLVNHIQTPFSASNAAANKNTTVFCSEIQISPGTLLARPAITAPIPKLTRRVGSAQQTSVLTEANDDECSFKGRMPLRLHHKPTCDFAILSLVGRNSQPGLNMIVIRSNRRPHRFNFYKSKIFSILCIGFQSHQITRIIPRAQTHMACATINIDIRLVIRAIVS